MQSQMTIGKKLMLSFGAAMALTVLLAWSALSSIGSLGQALDTEIHKTARTSEIAGEFSTAAYQMRASQRGVVMFTLLKDSSKADQNKEVFRAGAERLQKSIAEIRPLLVKPAARQAVDHIEAAAGAWGLLYQEILKSCAEQRFDPEFVRTLDRTVDLNYQVEQESANLMEIQKETQTGQEQAANSTVSSCRWIAVILIALTLAMGAVILWLVRQISAALRALAGELGEGATQTASASSQVSASSQSLAQGASEQAASLEETSASTEEIHSMARKNTENSQTAAELVAGSQQKIAETNQSLEQMVAAMGEIKNSSDKISKIIKTIDEIAFQTNILALNAAVEAARAGDAGMGFAVVADEVRSLAQRCAQAAKDTAALIEESIARSDDGQTKVDQVAVAMRAITEDSAKVKTLVDEVSLGSQEQARGIDQIGKAVTQMEEVTQKTAANAGESAAAAEALNAQSDALKAAVERLTAMVGRDGNGRSNGHRAASARLSPRPGESAPGLAALRSGRPPGPAHTPDTHPPAPVLAAVRPDKSAIPLEEEFKEF